MSESKLHHGLHHDHRHHHHHQRGATVRWTLIACAALLALAAVAALSGVTVAAPGGGGGANANAKVGPWTGPETDFKEVDGHIVGPWWQGGGLGAVYFTGPNAQKMKAFEQVAQAMAAKVGRPYLEIHKEQVLPSENDANGILAYPDGTARVRLFVMPGGNSFLVMADLAGVSDPPAAKAAAERQKFVEARKVPKGAFKTGMNYVGACGGFFSATSGYEVKNSLSAGWELWPGKVKAIGPGANRPFPDVVFDPAQASHPLVKATRTGVLKGMFYNGGPLGVQSDVPDTEYFGKYRGGNMPELADDWFMIAYKPKDDLLCGRCVITTGHPEADHVDFLMAMAAYALARDYEVPRRAIEIGKPVEAVAGDDQVQYYCLAAEAGRKMIVTLTGLSENCDLYLRAALPPTFKKNDLRSTNTKLGDEKITVPVTKAATYWIGVHGRHAVLNGAKYTLNVTME